MEKRVIFIDHQDESVFLSYLKEYLLPKDPAKLSKIANNPNSSPAEKSDALKALRLNNFALDIDLMAYCLMSNHWHLLIRQKHQRAIEQFMRSLCTRYVQYFNHRHGKRVGGLFQDTYKAVLVTSEEQLLHLSRYIHRNPFQKGLSLKESPHASSYINYLKIIDQDWVKPKEILGFFTKTGTNSYESFCENHLIDEASASIMKETVIDID
ncbi:MAG: transposase [Candidatus Amesbacteria bacterium]|nr:transposase [Candidatus Amesbacteria bacterium]